MGKHKHGKSSKNVTVPEPALSKKERKALEAREAKLVEELDARRTAIVGAPSPADGIDVTGLKGKQLRAIVADKSNPKTLRKAAKAELAARAAGAEVTEQSTPDEPPTKPKTPKGARVKPSAKARTEAAADQVLASNSTESARAAAATAKAAAGEASEDEDDESIKARVMAKRARRAELEDEAYRASVDRSNEADVTDYNAELASLGGAHFLTSTAESDRVRQGTGKAGKDGEASMPLSEKAQAQQEAFARDAAAQAAEVVETEKGREFAVGASVADDTFAKPSEAPRQLEEGRNGYKIIQLGADGKPDLKRDGTPRTVRQLTRVTTYIDCLEDKTNLEKWKLRTLLEGVALDDEKIGQDPSSGVPAIPQVRDLMHVRDTTIAKAHRQDAKGKLAIGERAKIEAAAVKAFKGAIDPLASDLLELGGVHDKANRGTNLHALAELYDAQGMVPLDVMVSAGTITVTDHASIVAYAEAIARLGLKVVSAETVIVNDEVGYAGRFDRQYLYRPEGASRAIRVIGDIKSGRVDYGFAKIEQQVAMYADGQKYDLETGERSPLGANKHVGLLVHLPQGEGTCTIHVLDLDRGRRGNKLAGAVRAWRSENPKAGDDLAAVSA